MGAAESPCSEKGYVLAVGDGYITGAVHVERDDELWVYPDDAAAATAAEQDGVRLIYGMEGVPDGIYLDTPGNRTVILLQLRQSGIL